MMKYSLRFVFTMCCFMFMLGSTVMAAFLQYDPTGFGVVSTNLDLRSKAWEYHREVSKSYNYNWSNARAQLTEEELIAQGGVCSHYTRLYNSWAERDGAVGNICRIDIPETNIDHEISIISDKDEICILDMTVRPFCYQLDGSLIPEDEK